MFKPTAIAIPLLTLFLAACGGGGGGDPVAGGSASGSENDENISNPDGETVQTGTEVGTPRLGIGSGSSFQQGQLTVENSQLGAGASTNISATIVDAAADNAKIVSKNYGVVFTSTCSESQPPQAGFSNASTITSGGEVTVTYTASGCSGTDTVTFRLYEVNASNEIQVTSLLSTAVATLNVAQSEVGELRFVANDTPAIGLNGVGNDQVPATAKVTFKVVDQTGSPISKKEVNFSIFPNDSAAELSLASNVTDDNGDVSVNVTAGSTPAQIRVRAATTLSDNTTISVDSLPISISTGLVSQIGFSLSANIYNPDAYSKDQTEVTLSVVAYDYSANPAPEGTNILFAAESGFVEPASCQTVGGRCSVIWRSGGARPGDTNLVQLRRANETESGTQVRGMTTITAYALGEAGFSDMNQNGLFDIGEPFLSFPEAYVDNNLDGAYSSLVPGDSSSVIDHLYFDIDGNNEYTAIAPTTYQGVLCSEEAKEANHCATLVHVRDSVRIVQSDSAIVPTLTLYDNNGNLLDRTSTYDISLQGNNSFYIVLRDVNGNTLPNGSEASIEGEDFDDPRLNHVSGDNSDGYINRFGDLPTRGLVYQFSLANGDDAAKDKGVRITVTVDGDDRVFTIPIIR